MLISTTGILVQAPACAECDESLLDALTYGRSGCWCTFADDEGAMVECDPDSHWYEALDRAHADAEDAR